MKLSSLPKLAGATERSKIRGRGYSSGKGGHTTGLGSKGQKARGKVRRYFEGGQLPLVRRLPHLPGFKRFSTKPVNIKIEQLNRFNDGDVVTPKSMVEVGLLPHLPRGGVKILGGGELSKKLTIRACLLSGQAKEEINSAGGTVE